LIRANFLKMRRLAFFTEVHFWSAVWSGYAV